MKIKIICIFSMLICISAFTGCSDEKNTVQSENSNAVSDTAVNISESNSIVDNDKIARADETAAPENVVEEGMTPVYADSLKDGVYSVEVDSSSSMFSIINCELTVADGKMTAVMTMSGKGYLYLFMGTGEDAVSADESKYIPFAENNDGMHTFTVPVESLDAGINCTAFSKNKEKWYDRILVFRADSLPADAFAEEFFTNADTLGLADGEYTVDVKLEGGSGKASVTSPTKLIVENRKAFAEIEFSSSNYNYMVVNGEHYDMINTDGNSKFLIPVSGFDYNMPVSANTTAMSTPHEIEYTLYFNSGTIK